MIPALLNKTVTYFSRAPISFANLMASDYKYEVRPILWLWQTTHLFANISFKANDLAFAHIIERFRNLIQISLLGTDDVYSCIVGHQCFSDHKADTLWGVISLGLMSVQFPAQYRLPLQQQ